MINPKRFQKLIDDEFWKHITKEGSFKDVIDYEDYNKETFVRDLSNKLTHFQHFFEMPDFLYIPKTNGILRRLKFFSVSDTIIYYYCLKELQAELSAAIKRVKYVYGGFKFSPDLMLKMGEIEDEAV